LPTTDFAVADGGTGGVLLSPDPPELPQAASVADNISAMPSGAKVFINFCVVFLIRNAPMQYLIITT
jgi:hypothetical protein